MDWTIEKLVPGGAGFTRLPDGRSGFAAGALPGERIRVLEFEDRKSYVVAKAFEVVSKSPERVEPRCSVASTCGGCDWMHLDIGAQIRAKAELIREALERTGGLRNVPEIQITSGANREHYRGRIRLHVGRNGSIGFFGQRSHALVEFETCLVASEEINHGVRVLRQIAAQHRDQVRAFSEIELRTAPGGQTLALCLYPREGAPLGRTKPFVEALRSKFNVATIGQRSKDVQDQRWPLPGGAVLLAPPQAFTQVNWDVNLALAGAVLEGARSRGVTRFCDLYCGAGNFSLPLLCAGMSGLGIEVSVDAIHAAERAATSLSLSDARFVAGDVEKLLREQALCAESYDLIVLDPPRAGAKAILPAIVEIGAPFIAYVACDPVTLARDLRTLIASGYELQEVRGFDMFPETHHVEVLAWLSRSQNV